jgi:ferrochelatase
MFFNHPGFIEANADRVRAALAESSPGAHVAFAAHSIPLAMAERSQYAAQLAESARLVSDAAGVADHEVVYQSRSGPPHVPWLEPDVVDHLRDLAARGVRDVVASPLGFLSDHVEVLYDLDVEAAELAEQLGLRFVRAGTPGTHPAFVAMIRELIQERLDPAAPRRALGRLGPSHDTCAPGCCLPGNGRASPWAA